MKPDYGNWVPKRLLYGLLIAVLITTANLLLFLGSEGRFGFEEERLMRDGMRELNGRCMQVKAVG